MVCVEEIYGDLLRELSTDVAVAETRPEGWLYEKIGEQQRFLREHRSSYDMFFINAKEIPMYSSDF